MKPYATSSADRIRLLCSVLGLAGLALYSMCLFRHTCMAGHLCHDHGPYTISPYANDAVWLILLPSVAVMCWWSNIYGRQILSLALLFLLATNAQIMTGILPWLSFHPVAIIISLISAVAIALGGLFMGGRAGREAASESDNARTKRVISMGVGGAVCVTCFALGYLSTERQRELDEQRYRRVRVAMRLDAYKTVTSTNWINARTKFGDDLLDEARNYRERFGMDYGTNRIGRMLSEAMAIADAIERQTKNAIPTNAPAAPGEQTYDPVTGLPTDHVVREKE